MEQIDFTSWSIGMFGVLVLAAFGLYNVWVYKNRLMMVGVLALLGILAYMVWQVPYVVETASSLPFVWVSGRG
jgi:hypothetical protein